MNNPPSSTFAGQPDSTPPPKYVVLGDTESVNSEHLPPLPPPPAALHPPPYRGALPTYFSSRYGYKSEDDGCNCRRCLCCCCCFFFIFFVILVALFLFLYFWLDPKIPSYNMERLSIKTFDIRPTDASLSTEFSVIVHAVNPNKNLGIEYHEGSSVTVDYHGKLLNSGKIPAFYQGVKNTTNVAVVTKGKTTFSSSLRAMMLNDQKRGYIPLNLYVRVPVGLVMHGTTISRITVIVNCSVTVDNLSPGKKVGIKSVNYNIALAL